MQHALALVPGLHAVPVSLVQAAHSIRAGAGCPEHRASLGHALHRVCIACDVHAILTFHAGSGACPDQAYRLVIHAGFSMQGWSGTCGMGSGLVTCYTGLQLGLGCAACGVWG